jgi:hypothetical protein
VISGSGEDSWNDTPWLVELRKKIVEYDALGVKMSGFSFAPQVLAVALVSEEPLFGGQFIHKHDHFAKTGSGQHSNSPALQ